MTKTLLAAWLIAGAATAQQPVCIKPSGHIALDIPEPSDICLNPKTGTYFIASDTGILFEAGHDGKPIRKVVQPNTDFEAVTVSHDTVFVVDESRRDVYAYDANSLKLLKTVNVPYSGGRNKGFEAIAANPRGGFVMVVEKDPVWLFELDGKFNVRNRVKLGIARDISAASYREGFLYLLSDEDMTLFKLDADYRVLQSWKLPVINPEGFAFDPEGNLLITCDDMQRLYQFNSLQP